MKKSLVCLLVVFVFLIFSFLIGCGHPYRHPNKPPSAWDRDYAECKYEAELATASIPLSRTGIESGVQRGLTQSRLIDQCMKLRGYCTGRNCR